MDRLGAMRVFVSVAKLRSFSEAARRLQLSPSVVTRAIAQLEDELGLTLLLRTTRSLRLTARGELYLESCQRILGHRRRRTTSPRRGCRAARHSESRGSCRLRPAARIANRQP